MGRFWELVVLSCVVAACGQSKRHVDDSPERMTDGGRGGSGAQSAGGSGASDMAGAAGTRVVIDGLTRPYNLAVGGGYLYFVDAGDAAHPDITVRRVPTSGGSAEPLAMLGDSGFQFFTLGPTTVAWTAQSFPSSGLYKIQAVPREGGSVDTLFTSMPVLSPVVADDAAVYSASSDEGLFSVSIAEHTKVTLAAAWGTSSLALDGSNLLVSSRGHEAIEDPNGTAPCLVETVSKTGGKLMTLYAGEPGPAGQPCPTFTIKAFDGGVAWIAPGSAGMPATLWVLPPGAPEPNEVTQIERYDQRFEADASGIYFTEVEGAGEAYSIVRASLAGDRETLWTGTPRPGWLALDETTVYFTASELAHDGGEAYGAILAVPK